MAGTELQCIVVTPEQTVCEKTAEFVVATLYDGEIGIGPGHTPLIGRLGYGELRIRNGGQTDRFYIEGGFVEVINNVVSLLTNRAIPVDKLNPATIRQQLEAAERQPTGTRETRPARDQAIAQARAQLRVAEGTKA
jgi:F-type H+-transporting ATPase subunit epsilon